MPSRKFEAFRMNDAEVVSAFRKIGADAAKDGSVSFQMGDQNVLTLPLSKLDSDPTALSILSHDAAVLDRATLDLEEGRRVAVIRPPNTSADQVTVDFPGGGGNVAALNATLIASVQRHLRFYGRTAATDEVLGTELAEFYRQREDQLHRLQNLSDNIIKANDDYRQRLDEEHDRRRSELDERLAAQLSKLQEEYDRKEKLLTKREEELSQQQKTLDDRSSTHARRALRKDLKETLAQRGQSFGLTSGTGRKRMPIHILFVTLVISFSILFTLALLNRLPAIPEVPWIALVRLPFITFALAGSLIFYIRWADAWFHQHADEEMRLKRLDLDIDRASWVVEMALEWKDAKGSDIPQELVNRLAANLFESQNLSRVSHPAEDLASALLGASSNIALKLPQNVELNVDRKGVKQFEKATKDKG